MRSVDFASRHLRSTARAVVVVGPVSTLLCGALMDDCIKRSPQFVRPSVIHGNSRYEQTPNTSLCFQFAILLYQMVTDHAGHFGCIHSLACTTNYGLHRCPLAVLR